MRESMRRDILISFHLCSFLFSHNFFYAGYCLGLNVMLDDQFMKMRKN